MDRQTVATKVCGLHAAPRAREWAITCRCRTASSAARRAVESNHFWRNSVAIFSNSLLQTALDFVNGMIAEHTNPKEEPIADEVGRVEA